MAALPDDVVSLGDLKAYLRVAFDTDDELLEQTLAAAVAQFQKDSGVQLLDVVEARTQKVEKLGSGDCVLLPGDRTVKNVRITTSDGTVLDTLFVPGDKSTQRDVVQGWVVGEPSSWVNTDFGADLEDVTVEWEAGILADTIPDDIKQGVRIKAQAFYDGAKVEAAYQAVVGGYRIFIDGAAAPDTPA